MRKTWLVGLLVWVAGSAHAADWMLDKVHSQVGFSIRHLVSKTRGEFKDYDFKLQYDPAKAEKSMLEATIQTTSIDTREPKRDEHLRSADFFDVAKFPTMTYKSSSVKRTAPNKLQVEGTLTLLGVSKPVMLDVEEGGIVKDPWGNTKAGFIATARINRKDFGMVWNKALDAGSLMLGDEVDITIEIEAADKKSAKKK